MGTIRERIKKDGSKRYMAEVRLKGHQPQRSTHRTRTAAKDWVRDTESAILDGRHFKSAESKKHTLGDLIDRFLTQCLAPHPKRKEKQEGLFLWWRKELGHLLLSDVTSAIIATARDKLLAETTFRKALRSPSTVNRYLAALSKALQVAVKEWGWLQDSPMAKVSKPSEAAGRHRFLSHEEKQRLLDVCLTSTNPNLYPIVAIALFTGLRYGELVTLSWSDIDFRSQSITLNKTKNGDRRVIPLTSEVERILKELPTFLRQPEGNLFQSSSRSKQVSIRGPFHAALKAAGIEGFRFHDLRHTAASYMAMSGATQGELMTILGHRTPQMTRRYAHYSQDHIKKILEKTGQTIIERNS